MIEIKQCRGNDNTCPCQDGLMCHYEGENPMTPLVPTPEEFNKELIATMYQIRTEYLEMKERMNHFEAWFSNAFDRIGTIEKQVAGLQQQMKIWFDGHGRGGMS